MLPYLLRRSPSPWLNPTHFIFGSVKWPQPRDQDAEEDADANCSQKHRLLSQNHEAVSAKHTHRQIR
jgi:hypothetical protein